MKKNLDRTINTYKGIVRHTKKCKCNTCNFARKDYRNYIIRKVFRFIGNILLVIIAIDIFGFILWGVSNQKPLDDFHAGMITEYLLNI